MAGSIKLFSFNRKLCHVVGIYLLKSNQNGPSINSRNWIIIISSVPFSLSSAAFFFFEANSMLEYGLPFIAASAALFFICAYLAVLWQLKNIGPFIEKCDRFIEKREHSVIVYRELNKKIERLCEFVGIGMACSVLIMTLPFLLYSFINYYILDLEEKSFLLFYPTTWPFDSKTTQGYFVAWLAQFAGLVAIGLMIVMVLNLLFGPYWLFMVMAEDITKDLVTYNKDIEANVNRSEWMKRFCGIVQLYSDAKELVNEFNAIVKYSLFFLILFCMLSVTSLLLILQFQLMDENAKLLDTFVIFILTLWIFGTLYFICELGQRVVYHFDRFRKSLERCDWHTLPIGMQRMFLLLLSDTQQPKNIKCYFNILLTRETFKMIINTAWSYFMSLRQLET